ncbi:hypothetical protein EPO15_04945 [bacterium]|nr:MAG: hypothetical protein EPO15_04945 [bacterium]
MACELATALLAALLLPAPAAALFGSTDGVLSLEERPGWQTAPPQRGAVLTLRNGDGLLSLEAAPDDAAPFALVVAQGVRLRRAGRPVSEPESRVSAGGLPYMVSAASAAGRGEPELLGAVAVDRARYVFSSVDVPLDEALALLDSLERHQAAADAAPPTAPPAGPAEAKFFGGLVRLPRPDGARLAPQADGWVVAVGKRWSLGVSDGGEAGGPGGAEFLRLRGEALVRTRGCRPADAVDHPLANGWTATLKPFTCPDALPGMVVVIGTVDRGRRPPLYLAGDYGSVAAQDQSVSWLASGTDEALKPQAAPWKTAAAGRTLWPWYGLLAGTAGLFVLALRRR